MFERTAAPDERLARYLARLDGRCSFVNQPRERPCSSSASLRSVCCSSCLPCSCRGCHAGRSGQSSAALEAARVPPATRPVPWVVGSRSRFVPRSGQLPGAPARAGRLAARFRLDDREIRPHACTLTPLPAAAIPSRKEQWGDPDHLHPAQRCSHLCLSLRCARRCRGAESRVGTGCSGNCVGARNPTKG
jgi:hypothetical protein